MTTDAKIDLHAIATDHGMDYRREAAFWVLWPSDVSRYMGPREREIPVCLRRVAQDPRLHQVKGIQLDHFAVYIPGTYYAE